MKEEMNSDETYIKVNCIHRLKVVCTVLGADAVRQHLVPYLNCM